VLDGHAFEVICANDTLLKHFTFIVHFCKHLLAYNMTAIQKGILVDVIYQRKGLQQTVCTVGSGSSNAIMAQKASVAVVLDRSMDGDA